MPQRCLQGNVLHPQPGISAGEGARKCCRDTCRACRRTLNTVFQAVRGQGCAAEVRAEHYAAPSALERDKEEATAVGSEELSCREMT